jgi:4-diphosphocytidyl-2-C-methyl-D-erythritol kinase
MTDVSYLSPAKINLFLHITSKRADGYHNLQTLFQLLDFCDEIRFSLRDDGQINRIKGNEDIVAEDDLLIKSARALKKYSNSSLGVDISIDKKIPAGGGLGGGSSNAATVLLALNELWQLNLDRQTLADIGLTLGADVPVFVFGRSAWAQGIGEILESINLPQYYYLVVSINKHISTAEIFSHKALTMTPVQRKIADFSRLSDLHNDCLDAAISLQNEIKQALKHLDSTANHLDNARMTGTGCCVFVAFEKEKDALVAKKQLPEQWFGFVAQAINTSPA